MVFDVQRESRGAFFQHGPARGLAPSRQTSISLMQAGFVAILEEPHDGIVRIDNETIDRRYVESGALAKR